MTVESTVCEEAQAIIHGPRRDDYGSPLESFDWIARLWAPLLGVAVTFLVGAWWTYEAWRDAR